MKSSILLTGILILAVAGLCFGQADRQAMPPNTRTKVKSTAQQKIDASKAAPYLIEDSMQCIMKHDAELTAAYTAVANSGCKKVKSGQSSQYWCGVCGQDPGYSACEDSLKKIRGILDGCRLKPPQHTPPEGPDGIAVDTPGCNSLGISCSCTPT
jgi:hypothetical protein